MLTVVDRIAGFGLRTLATGTRAAVRRVRRHQERTAGTRTRKHRRFGRIVAAGTALWWGFGAMSVHAADRGAAMTLQAGVGMLPLVAAMAVGIAVAAIAVVAFLQMTTKDRYGRKTAEEEASEEAAEALLTESGPESESARPGEPGEPEADPEDSALDRTMPYPIQRERPQPALPAERGKPSLLGLEGEFAGSGFQVPTSWLTLGRDASQCGLLFPYDAGEVSRKHCSLRYEEKRGVFLLKDHHSSNGTFLPGGERLEPEVVYELSPGTRFAISGRKHWFEVQI